MKNLFLIATLFLLFSCADAPKKTEVKVTESPKEKMVMYQPSEMANLMNEMYQANMKVKNQIKAGQLPEGFPEKFKNIHKAVLTDPNDRTPSFEVFSDNYLASLESVYKATAVEDAQERFNNTINACVACHQTTCTGPIPRIKKLLIK